MARKMVFWCRTAGGLPVVTYQMARAALICAELHGRARSNPDQRSGKKQAGRLLGWRKGVWDRKWRTPWKNEG